MKLIFQTLALVVSIPLVALALEPSNPAGFCDRFIADADVEFCKARIEKDEVDWYAATVCNLQNDDKAFWNCWDSIKGKSFNPQALEKCGETQDFSDEQRQNCVNGANSGRKPASHSDGLYQPLKLKTKKK
ncbi:hypothetical protein [Bdellovibrio sp.]|uniref:hypothetical protein n=1 Tax=Bdellovibrio sp. TaxID=28201 RepID=UPI0039E576C3